jgi:Glycosyltransferase family 87
VLLGGPRAARAAIAVHGAFAIAFAVVVARTLADPRALAQTDFTAFYTGWWLILHGRGADLYDVVAQRAAQHAIIGDHEFPSGLLAFLHPPHAALAGLPLGLVAERFGEPVAFWLWTAINVALLARLARGLAGLLSLTSLSGRALIATALLGSFPVFLTLREGQVAILLAVALLGLYTATRQGRAPAAAGWLLVLSLKPQLVPLPLALLVARRQGRTLAYAVIFAAAALLASAAALGPAIFGRYLGGLGVLQAHLGRGVPVGMLSLRGLLVRTLGAENEPLATRLSFVALGVASLALGLAARRRPEAPGALSGDERLVFATTFAAALFFSPHLFPADLTLWAVPLALTAAALRDGGDARAVRAFGVFALAWPLTIGLTLAVGAWPRLFFEAATGLCLVALVWISRLAGRASRG